MILNSSNYVAGCKEWKEDFELSLDINYPGAVILRSVLLQITFCGHLGS